MSRFNKINVEHFASLVQEISIKRYTQKEFIEIVEELYMSIFRHNTKGEYVIETMPYDKDNWKILEWGIINLTNREEIKCKKCGLNASCYTDINDEFVYYCKKHLPKDIKQPEFDEIFTE